MPTIYPNLIPTIQPGYLFSKFVSDQSLSVRWITKTDPVFYEIMNRPISDVAVRQLILAKAIDQINLRLSHQAYFPFVTQAKLISGLTYVDLPTSWLWDMNTTLPEKWTRLRLAKVKRISGTNPTEGSGGTETETYTGVLRLFFTATVTGGPTEYYLFYVDYDIASPLAFQLTNITIVTTEETNPVTEAERNTIAGQILFRTLDLDDPETRTFLDLVPPPVDTLDSNHDGIYDNPASYEIASDEAGVFEVSPSSHGSGTLTDSAWNRLPDLGASVDAWIEAFNYPFRITSDRQSYTIVDSEPITIPGSLFTEFNMTAPAGDNEPVDLNSYPVWVTRIKLGTPDPTYLTFYFATYNISDGNTSMAPVEFAYMIVNQNNVSGDIVKIESFGNLLGMTGSNLDPFNQQLGRGHAVLSSKWGTTEVTDFFNKFPLIVGADQAEFVQTSTLLSPFGLSRIPKYTPTKGQNEAMIGSTARRTAPVYPNDDNRYVTEGDQGIGNRLDLNTQTNPITGFPIVPNPDIEQYGYEGSLLAKKVTLIVNASGTSHQYETDILPRLRCLFGRDFVQFDEWFDGTRKKFWDTLSEAWIG